ncbi:hypothetical protein AB1K54_07165 [Microbacterium sp. BWT-B31]|uniref:hypothetical protein n=1 Tax=Microbacterium sp. BWT-B31 TaxID=3232072 RepID=UPI003528C9E7
MDASDRAELDALRRRAYGPARESLPDDALARLIALEDRVRAEAAASAAPVRASPAPDGALAPNEAPAPDDATVEPAPPRSPGRRTAIAVAVAAVAGALALSSVLTSRPDDTAASTAPADDPAAPAARAFVEGPDTRVVARVPLDGSFGNYIDLPAPSVPAFPGHAAMTWAAPLGDYYGFALWIAGATAGDSPEHCILVDRDGPAAGRCIPTAQQDQGGLLVSIPYEEVPRDRRPAGMTAQDHLAYWWGSGNAVTILVGPRDEP